MYRAWYVSYNFFVGGMTGFYWGSKIVTTDVSMQNQALILQSITGQLCDYHHQNYAAGVNIVFLLDLGEIENAINLGS